MKTCDHCGERHANLARFEGDDPGCNHDRLAGNPWTEALSRSNLEGVMDVAARIYRKSPEGSDTAELARLVVNLAEALRDTLPEDDDGGWHPANTSEGFRRTSSVIGFSVPS